MGRLAALTLILAGLADPAGAWVQERTWEGPWELHPAWWPVIGLAGALVLLVLLGWALLHLIPVLLGIGAAVLGIRWLMRATGPSERRDEATALLRERYARGEVGREEFEERMRVLGPRP
jgi:uncharacterized membrane protein